MKTKFLILLALGFSLMACAPTEFTSGTLAEETPVDPQNPFKVEPYSLSENFAYTQVKDFFTQDSYQRNKITITFQALDSKGQSVKDLTRDNVGAIENRNHIEKFELSSSNVNLGTKADIVFVFDVTSSMQPTINQAKDKVRAFVELMKTKGIKAQLCLVTFRDDTEKKCESFKEDDPATPADENLTAFLDELSKLKAKGGGDTDENQLRGLMDAALLTPWRANAQRLAILVTDETFHYAPGNEGDAGSRAPKYEDALKVLANAQLSIFAVAPSAEGYNKNFGKLAAITSLGSGLFFNYQDMIKGKTSMETIFNSIIERISTQYTIEYFVDDHPALQPDLPITQRNIEVQVKHSTVTNVMVVSKQSNYPEGRPAPKNRFRLSKEPLSRTRNVTVSINDLVLGGSVGYRVLDGELIFDRYPASEAKITISYDPAFLRDNVQLHSLLLPQDLDPESVKGTLNGIPVGLETLRLSRDLEGRYVLDLGSFVFAPEDPFKIIDQKGIHLQLTGYRTLKSE